MSELRVPVVPVAAEALCADGRTFAGRIFLPAAAASHTGPMKPEEWMNATGEFFALAPDAGGAPEILNRRQLVWLTVPAPSFEAEIADLAGLVTRPVTLECGTVRLEGRLLIDMPEHHARVLDHLNRPEWFLTLWVGERHYLVNKRRITRLLDQRED
jgi:hypothetical protein